MKALLINGSPHKNGCTNAALAEVAKALEADGIDTEIAWIGRQPVRGCQACRSCAESKSGRCIYTDDIVNTLLEKAIASDALIVGSPVYYAGPNGALTSVLDRIFYAAGSQLRYKPGASVASARRAGTTSTLDRLNKYFQINCMPLVSSNYWPMVHGNTAEEAAEDEEGMQTMRILGQNMAWLLHSIEAGKRYGVSQPQLEAKTQTSFIR